MRDGARLNTVRAFACVPAVILTIPAMWTAAAQTPSAPDADAIIRKSLTRDFFNYDSIRNYTYNEREEDRQYTGDGKLKKTESETDEILILGGRPYDKRIAKNDQPLSESDARHEQEKMDKELTKREHMTGAERAKVEKDRAEERAYMREIPDAFSFKLLGEEKISGKPAWIIQADPKPGYRPKDSKAKLLTKVRGKIWIDEGEYHWVKMEAQVLDPISFGLGLFRIGQGGILRFEQKRVNDEVWLPTHIFIRGDARLAYVKKMHAEIEVTYSDYRKFQSDSRIVSVDQKP
jgi:hypothetical protein